MNGTARFYPGWQAIDLDGHYLLENALRQCRNLLVWSDSFIEVLGKIF